MHLKGKPSRIVSIVVAVVVLASSALTPVVAGQGPGFDVTGFQAKSIPMATMATIQKTATRGSVSADRKTVRLTGKTARLVVTTGPETDMLSYRIAGLRNPTLGVPAGAVLKVLFINTDSDMFHSLRFTTQKPPFGFHINEKATVGSHTLAPRAGNLYRAEEMTVTVPRAPGRYIYVCTVVGHAKGGMYGTLIVR